MMTIALPTVYSAELLAQACHDSDDTRICPVFGSMVDPLDIGYIACPFNHECKDITPDDWRGLEVNY